MDAANQYRVEKLRRTVTVVLVDGRRLEGEVFLWNRSKAGDVPEEPIELLNDEHPFFPFSRDERDFLLISKENVSMVEACGPAPDAGADVGDEQLGVELTLTDGTAISGFISVERRGESTRLLDFLNNYRKRFLPIVLGEQLCLVNRSMIATVSQLT